jgi:hypothetical protein
MNKKRRGISPSPGFSLNRAPGLRHKTSMQLRRHRLPHAGLSGLLSVRYASASCGYAEYLDLKL